MSKSISSFEKEILCAVLKQNFPSLGDFEQSLKALRVTSREITDVGGYVHFSGDQEKILSGCITRLLGFDGEISIPGIPSGLGAVLTIDDGIISFLELFTYGDEQWDGQISGARVTY